MKTAFFAFSLALLALALAQQTQQKLNYLEEQENEVTVEQLISKFAELQPEIYRKVFQHFINDEIKTWREQGKRESQIREKVLVLLTDAEGPLLASLTDYMQRRLFSKLQMGLLTKSLQDEIKAHPDNFYLTFDIYDLLFD